MGDERKILIVGGGFGGVACALRLCQLDTNAHIRLISDNPNFEYHGAMYRVVTGKSPLEVVFPLEEIFPQDADSRVEIVKDRVIKIDLEKKMVCSESECTYGYDELVLAVGSETIYFDTPGMAELSFGYKSIHEAIELKRQVQTVLSSCKLGSKDEQICDAHFIVVGGGPAGTELAAELVVYAKKLAEVYGVDPSLVTVDLIQSSNRLVPQGSERLSAAIEKRIRSLGVNVYLNRRVVKEEVENVFMKDMEMKAKTVIWTAGTGVSKLIGEIEGLEVNGRGQVIVNGHLQAKNNRHVWVVGDCAEVEDSGLAQAALFQGRHVAEEINFRMRKLRAETYQARKWILSVPVGPGWAATEVGGFVFTGRWGWMGRRLLDMAVFISILPISKAWKAFVAGNEEWESGLA